MPFPKASIGRRVEDSQKWVLQESRHLLRIQRQISSCFPNLLHTSDFVAARLLIQSVKHLACNWLPRTRNIHRLYDVPITGPGKSLFEPYEISRKIN